MSRPANPVTLPLADYSPKHFLLAVVDGVVRKGAKVRIIRQDIVLQEMGTLVTLKRFKDEVNEVQSGKECGMNFGFSDIKAGDVVECFTVEEVKRAL